MLLTEDKENIVKEYKLHKQDKTFGYHASAWSKVNDITQTLRKVEYELYSFFFFFLLVVFD